MFSTVFLWESLSSFLMMLLSHKPGPHQEVAPLTYQISNFPAANTSRKFMKKENTTDMLSNPRKAFSHLRRETCSGQEGNGSFRQQWRGLTPVSTASLSTRVLDFLCCSPATDIAWKLAHEHFKNWDLITFHKTICPLKTGKSLRRRGPWKHAIARTRIEQALLIVPHYVAQFHHAYLPWPQS